MERERFVRRIRDMQDKLYRIACGQLRIPQDREDAVQEAILRAWRMRGSLRQEEYFETWLIRILINECRNIQRAKKRMLPVENVPEPQQDLFLPTQFSELHEAIWALPEKLRLPVILHYVEGYATREAAQILHVPHGTLCGRLRQAREKLKELLEK